MTATIVEPINFLFQKQFVDYNSVLAEAGQ